MRETQVKASEVREGDFLTGLDNGYVIETVPNETPYYDGYRYTTRGEGLVSITFNTADGDEGELIVPDEMPLTVGRDED